MSEKYKFCILTDDKDIIEYEKGLHNFFYKREKDHWEIDGKRMRHKINYKDQMVLGIKSNEGEILGGTSINFNFNNLQLEKDGFQLPDHLKNSDMCEGLAVYVYQEKTSIFTPRYFHDYMLDEVKKLNKKYIYGVAYEDTLRPYKKLKWEVIEEKIINNEKLFLVRYHIKDK